MALGLEKFDCAKDIERLAVPLSDECRKMCEQNMCGSYGRNWMCPPAIGSLAELQRQFEGYDRCLIVTKVYTLEDSYDWEGMKNGAKNFQDRLMEYRGLIAAEAPQFGYLMLGAGACLLCPTCSHQVQEPCRFPDKAIVSLEAFGVDVMRMMAEQGLKYNNGVNTVTYIGGIFYCSDPAAANAGDKA
ncbi:MAG: DUF2284 domain-containing protein [Desulfopila sp.]